MAVLKETEGRGPFASLIMAVVIVKDVVVFVCFAINIEMADVVSPPVIPSVNHRGLSCCSPASCRLKTVPNEEDQHTESKALRPLQGANLTYQDLPELRR